MHKKEFLRNIQRTKKGTLTMNDFELNLDQVIAEAASELAKNDTMAVKVSEYNLLRDIQTRFYIVRKYIESHNDRYSLDMNLLNLLLEIENKKEGEE